MVSIFLALLFPSPEEISLQTVFVIITVAVIVIIYVVYKRIGELGEEIVSTKEQYQKLEERLKIHQQLTNIEARIIVLEGKNGKKKN